MDWDLKRKMRIEQVRHQTKNIGKDLLEKNRQQRLIYLQNLKKEEEELLRRKTEEERERLQKAYWEAFKDFGLGHALQEEVAEIKTDNKQTTERGKLALRQEIKNKLRQQERKQSLIRRKQLTRDIENVRAALISGMPPPSKLQCLSKSPGSQQQVLKDICVNKVQEPGIVRRPQPATPSTSPTAHCMSRRLTITPIKSDNIPVSSRNDGQKSFKTTKYKRQKSLPPVEMYDHSSRHCKNYQLGKSLVVKLDYNSEPDASERNRLESEVEEVENEKREHCMGLSEKRGHQALRRSKLQRDYQQLLKDLKDLTTKEKKLSAVCKKNKSSHMDDRRLHEKHTNRQKQMDTKFEHLYHGLLDNTDVCVEQTLSPPTVNLANLTLEQDPGDDEERLNKVAERVSKQRNILINKVDQVLQEANRLRVEIDNSDSDSSDKENVKVKEKKRRRTKKKRKIKEKMEIVNDVEDADDNDNYDFIKVTVDVCENDARKNVEDDDVVCDVDSDLLNVTKQTDKSEWLYSPSTCYKSPPQHVTTGKDIYHLDQMLNALRQMRNGKNLNLSPRLMRNIDRLLDDTTGRPRTVQLDDDLLYYINKLVHMSRTCIDELDVSSVTDISTPCVSELDYSHSVPDERDKLVTWKDQLKKHDLQQLAKEKTERISQLANMIEEVRREQGCLLNTSSATLTSSLDTSKDTSHYQKRYEPTSGVYLGLSPGSNDSRKADYTERFDVPDIVHPHRLSTIIEVDSSQQQFPNIENELLRRRIISSPLHNSEDNDDSYHSTYDNVVTPRHSPIITLHSPPPVVSEEEGWTTIGSGSYQPRSPRYQDVIRQARDKARNLFRSQVEECLVSPVQSELDFQQLGVGWANSFLRRNQQSRAVGSNSDHSLASDSNQYLC